MEAQLNTPESTNLVPLVLYIPAEAVLPADSVDTLMLILVMVIGSLT